VPALPRPGDRLAGFRIERELGHGTTGVVFLARQEGLDRRVALKVVGRPLADDAAFRERFRREARAVAGLDHPNVVQVLQSGEDDGHLWLAMRYVDGPDLRVLLRRTGRLDPEQAVAVVEQIAAALDAAHAAGLVHRDVKPSNVLIEDGPGRDLHVELADFGLARAPGAQDPDGTPGYAAPEQLGGAEAGPAADVFGLGCVLYELLTGVAPPPPVAADEPGVPWRRPVDGRHPPLRPSVALPALGGAFDPAVERATDPDPAARFASAGDLALWARAALTVPRAAPAVVPADPVRVAASTPASPAEVGPAEPTWESAPAPRPRKRGRRRLLVAFLVLVLAGLAAAFVFLGDLDPATRDARTTAGGAPTPPGGATGRGGTRTTASGGAAGSGGTGTTAGGASAARGSGGSGGAAGGSGRSPGTSGSGPGSRGGAAGGAGATGAAGPGSADRGASPGSSPSAGAGSSAPGGTAGPVGSSSSGAPGTAGSPSSGARGSTSSAEPGSATTGRGSSGVPAVPQAGPAAPAGATTVALPPVPAGFVRFGGGGWVLDLPAAEGWRQTAVQELDGGARILTRLARPDAVRLVVEALPGRTAVVGVPGARTFPVRLPDAGRTDGALYRGGRYAMCRTGVCAALPANGPNGGVLLIAGAHRAAGARRVARRAAAGLRVR
jgi:hypothetical protein